MASKLKEEMLKLLETDIEFRYAIAGYIGLSENLKRLDRHEEELIKLREEQMRMNEELKNLRIEQMRMNMESIRLREDFNKMLERINIMDKRLSRVERTLEKLTLDIEDEARTIIEYKFKNAGIRVKIGSLIIPGVLELNIYGVSDDLCILGEATVRASENIVDELLNKVNILKEKYPQYLRSKVILVIYTSPEMPGLIEKAKKHNIWILKAIEDIYKPDYLREILR